MIGIVAVTHKLVVNSGLGGRHIIDANTAIIAHTDHKLSRTVSVDAAAKGVEALEV